MSPHYTYLIIDIATMLFPLLLSFDKRVAFYKSWGYLAAGIFITGTIFIGWDIAFTQWNVWSFNNDYTLGYRPLGLPVEEWLFFIAVPYSCAFIYRCLLAYIPFDKRVDRGRNLLLVLGIALIDAGIFYRDRAYTFATFTLCGSLCIMLYVFRKRNTFFRADAFLLTFLISIIPFFVVNGLLTSIPVVIYNNRQTLGIRLYTIPLEDTFYGMLLMMGTILGMEWRRETAI